MIRTLKETFDRAAPLPGPCRFVHHPVCIRASIAHLFLLRIAGAVQQIHTGRKPVEFSLGTRKKDGQGLDSGEFW